MEVKYALPSREWSVADPLTSSSTAWLTRGGSGHVTGSHTRTRGSGAATSLPWCVTRTPAPAASPTSGCQTPSGPHTRLLPRLGPLSWRLKPGLQW